MSSNLDGGETPHAQPASTGDAPARISIFLGVPCTQTGITETFLHSALALQRHCAELGWNLRIATRSDGLVTRTRNIFGSRMVKCDDFTHLLMVDADIGFDPCVVERMVRSGHDFVGACVPLREVKWEPVHDAIKKGADLSPEQMQSLSHGHAVSFPHKEKDGDGGKSSPIFGFLPARFIGSAMMLARRQVFLEMSRSDLVVAYENGTPWADAGSGGWTFFDPLVDPERKLYLSEDYAFCHRWRALGGTVWADLRSRVTHSGVVTVAGDVGLTLRTAAMMQQQQ